HGLIGAGLAWIVALACAVFTPFPVAVAWLVIVPPLTRATFAVRCSCLLACAESRRTVQQKLLPVREACGLELTSSRPSGSSSQTFTSRTATAVGSWTVSV